MQKFFSQLLNLTGEENDGTVTFSDGTVYSKEEILLLKKESPEDIKKLHWVKSAFGGDLEFCGKNQTISKKEIVPDSIQLSLFGN